MLHKGRKINTWGKCTEINENETFEDTIQKYRNFNAEKNRDSRALDHVIKDQNVRHLTD